jgi:hypothetical protein
MNKFRITILACLLMLLAVPFTEQLAVANGTPLHTHLLYVVGHDGYLHYLVNAWSLLVMHNLFRWYRALSAYLFAVLLSFIALPDQPMVGASVFTCFFFGFTAPWLWVRERLVLILTIGLLLLTCVLPGFAGIPHVASFSFGVLFSFGESYVRRIRQYLSK